MATWAQFIAEVPDLAEKLRGRFEAHRHKTMATLRLDGSPRISGTEVPILDPEVYLAGMVGARRFEDLRRDPRVAVHSGSDDPERWTGDAKLDGRAVELVDPGLHEEFRRVAGEVPEGPFELFRVDLTGASVIELADGGDHLLVHVWREGHGLRTVVRR